MIRLAKLLSQKIFSDTYGKKITVDTIKMSDGLRTDWAYIDCPPSVIVVALDQNKNILLISQYRYTIKNQVTENIAGGIKTGKTQLQTAKAELFEESGYQSKKFINLGQYYDLPNETNHFCTIFLALNCRQVSLPVLDDEEEKNLNLKLIKHPFLGIYNSLGTRSCPIKSSEHVAAVFLAHRYLSSHRLL